MGKISDADFDDMRRRLRARAMMVMRQLDVDAGGYREIIERDLAGKLAAAGAGPDRVGTPPAEPRVVRDADARPSRRSCPSCETSNDVDARFCKQCGSQLL
jgi:hypothetical protein